MSVTNLKARPAATADRISEDIARPSMIKDQMVCANSLKHVAAPDSLDAVINASVPLEFWLAHKQDIVERGGFIAVQVAADESPLVLVEDLHKIDCIVLPFVTGVDGRSYSHAYRLRTQLGFTGEIRATGDVKRDTLGFLQRVGVNAFELSEEQDLQAALTAFADFSDVYQPSADAGELIFARRRRHYS